MPNPENPTAADLASFYGDSERVLRQQLAANPANVAVRLKLAEVYYETSRRSDFLREVHELARRGFDRQALALEWNRVVSMGRMLGIDDRLFDNHEGDRIEFVEPAKAASTHGAAAYVRIGEDPRYQGFFAELAQAHAKVQADPRFLAELDLELARSANRPSSLEDAKRLTRASRGAQIYFKREDLSPLGTLLTISVIGQAMLAQRLYRHTLVGATASGFRGTVIASVAARLGLYSKIFMDREAMHRLPQVVFQMRLLGADVIGVHQDSYPGMDVRYAALDFCLAQPEKTFLTLALDGAPPPYPVMTREFVSTIGRESRRQARAYSQRAPDLLVTRGGNSRDAIGLFEPFLAETGTRLVCVEGQHDLAQAGEDDNPFTVAAETSTEAESLLAQVEHRGLELPAAAREHAFLKASGRVEYVNGSPMLAKKAIMDLSRLEGLVPPINTAHAIGWAIFEAKKMRPDQVVVVMLAERVDKDMPQINQALSDLIKA